MKHDNLEKCETVIKCPACGHYHNHMGCKECDCKICPHCMHVHSEHHNSEHHNSEHVHNEHHNSH